MSVNHPSHLLPFSKVDLAEKVLSVTLEKKIPAVQQPLLRNTAVSSSELSFVSSARNTGNHSKNTVKVSFYLILLPCFFFFFLINPCEIEKFMYLHIIIFKMPNFKVIVEP